jgi:hypothetical protein
MTVDQFLARGGTARFSQQATDGRDYDAECEVWERDVTIPFDIERYDAAGKPWCVTLVMDFYTCSDGHSGVEADLIGYVVENIGLGDEIDPRPTPGELRQAEQIAASVATTEQANFVSGRSRT